MAVLSQLRWQWKFFWWNRRIVRERRRRLKERKKLYKLVCKWAEEKENLI